MKIKKVEIHNWRSIVHTVIEFNNLMIFIGQNNHGKSNILNAIRFFFGEIPVNQIDFNNKDTDIHIEVEFDELNVDEKTTFKKYVTSKDTIKVRKTVTPPSNTFYNGYKEIPEDDWLREEKISDYTTRSIAEKLPLVEFLPQQGRITKNDFRYAQDEYITKYHNDLKFTYELEKTNFLGAKNVAKGIFGELFYIPSIKKASEELSAKGNSTFGKLYSKVIGKISENDKAYIDAKTKINELIKILNKNDEKGNDNPLRPQELTSLENTIAQELKSWNTTIDIEITPPNIDDIFKMGASIWVDDGIRTDIDRKGHGLQRALIFALVKAWAKVIREESSLPEDISTKRKASEATYFIFEEPELFLHPQAQRELFSSLLDLCQNNNQIVLCTHSSSFIDLNHYKSICIVKKNNLTAGTKVLQYVNDIFQNIEEKKKFNLCYWFNPERSELFFAKKIILIEGATDKSVILNLSKKLEVFKHDYSIIDCGSKDNIPIYISLLNKFRLRYIAVYDQDHQSYKTSNGISCSDKSSKLIEDSIDQRYGESVILENDIEEEIGIQSTKESKNKPYKAIEFLEKEEYVIPTSIKTKIIRIYA